MKKQLLALSLFTLITGAAMGQVVLIYEDFDSYNDGDLLAQTAGAPWSTWSVSPGSTEDTPISNEQASSGALSAKVTGAPAGGPTDLMLQLGNRTTGSYALSWQMFVPSGNGGYFNIQRNEVPGAGSFMLEVTFNDDGTIDFVNDAVTTTGTYTQDQWFNVLMLIDLGAMTGTLLVDGTPQYSWQTNVPGPNQLGGIDFFAFAGGAPSTPLYYFDDVTFIDLLATNVPDVAAAEVKLYPNPTIGALTIERGDMSKATSVSILDATGRVVMPNRAIPGFRTTLDLGHLPDGLYFVRMLDGDREVVRRITKQ